ncbi:TPA: hypothetical protein I7730_01550 [Vibrio vulnificus]|uniref:Uncharacterized protein n=1 Tax=Vibrio vulnificus TaxID=672 RepID=A0A8H9MVJ9_VIBVL|nr:hypothetical protein [Vibrio vulnificus]
MDKQIKIFNSDFIRFNYDDETISRIEEELNTIFSPTTPLRVTLAPQVRKTDVIVEQSPFTQTTTLLNRVIVEFDSQTIIQTRVALPIEVATLAVSLAVSMQSCSHTFDYKKNWQGLRYPDGTGACVYCGFEAKNVLPKLSNLKSYSNSILSRDPYITDIDWGNAHAQCGGYYNIHADHPLFKRETSFFEVSPTVSGISTFIHCKGNDEKEAELKALSILKRYTACDGHNWDRMGHTDGTAVCTECGLEGVALEPLNKCQVCKKPTNNRIGFENIICLDHMFEFTDAELANFDVCIWRSEETGNDRQYLSDEDIEHKYNRLRFEFTFSYMFLRAFYETKGQTWTERNQDQLDSIYRRSLPLILKYGYGVKFKIAYIMDRYPDEACRTMARFFEHFKQISGVVSNLIESDGSVSPVMLIPDELTAE